MGGCRQQLRNGGMRENRDSAGKRGRQELEAEIEQEKSGNPTAFGIVMQ